MHFLRHCRRRRLAGADRPDRLVGQHQLRHGIRTHHFQHRVELGADHGLRGARLALAQRFADAHDRGQAGIQRRPGLARDEVVRFAMVGAALGVADDHVTATEILQHRGTDFAGEGAARLGRDVLRAPGHGTACEKLFTLEQVGSGDADGARGARLVQSSENTLQQLCIGCTAAVHLPVTYDEFGTHTTPCQITRYSSGRSYGGQTKAELLSSLIFAWKPPPLRAREAFLARPARPFFNCVSLAAPAARSCRRGCSTPSAHAPVPPAPRGRPGGSPA